MSDKPSRRHRNSAPEPADKRVRARRADAGLSGKLRQGAGTLLRSISARLKMAMRALRRVLFRLIRKSVLFLMGKKGDAPAGKANAKKRASRRSVVIYAGSCLIVAVVVLLVLFVPSKAAEIPAGSSASPNLPETPGMWQASAGNAIPTTNPDIAPVPTTPPDAAPTPTLKPAPTPTPKPTATKKPPSTPKPPTATPRWTNTPRPAQPTDTPKPKPTSTPKPVNTPPRLPTDTPSGNET